MCHARRTVIAVVAALIVGSLAAAGPIARAGAAESLETRTLSAYDIRADGSVHVTVTARVTNRDPSTERRGAGQVFFYSAAAFAVHDAASNLTARSGSASLGVETRDRDEPLRVVAVRFNRGLYFNESIDITLDYDLTAVRAAQVLVNGQYAFVPALAQGAESLLRITAPAGRRLTITSANCGRMADSPVTYTCGGSTAPEDYRAGGRCAFAIAEPAWSCAFTGRDLTVVPFEATAPDLALAQRSSRVSLSSAVVELRVQHFVGDEAWAARVEDLIRRGLPILEEANGYAYPGPAAIDVVESGYRDTHGYEGLATTQGRIRLTPVVEDQTVLHEVSHLWSDIFASRWLAEGMADYTANIAARRLGVRPELPPIPLPPGPLLEEWGPLRTQLAVSRTERDAEEAGYARSLRFIELLAERAGPRGIADANATLAQERVRGTARGYLDTLEQVSGVPLSPLFAEWALTPADAALLPARESARRAALTLRERTANAGLSPPADLGDALRGWKFDRVEQIAATATSALDRHGETLAQASAAGIDLGGAFAAAFARGADQAAGAARDEATALSAVTTALQRAGEARSPLMRFGLLGTGTTAREASIRAALARGDYETAASDATSFQRRLDRAERDGAIRLAVAALALTAFAALGLWMGRRQPRPNPPTPFPRREEGA